MINSAMIPPGKSGGTRHHTIARHLLGTHDITLVPSSLHHTTLRDMFGMTSDAQSFRFEGVPYFVVRPFERPRTPSKLARIASWFGYIKGVLKWTRQLPQPDVIVGSSPTPIQALAAAWLAQRHRVPFVLEIRDLWPQTLIDIGGYSPRNPFVWLFGRIERYLYRRADQIITLMAGSEPYIVARGGDADRIHVIPNGVDLPLVDAARGDSPFDPSYFNILYTGSHSLSDAIDSMLDAAKIVWESGQEDVRFHFMGEGHLKPFFIQRVKNESIKNVQFYDAVPKDQVYVWMKSADVLIINKMDVDLYRHGVSFNKLFDYMASARPVLYAVPSDMMERSGGGLSCTPDNAQAMAETVLQLKHIGPDARAAMGQSGRAYVEKHHNLQALAQKYAAVLDAAVARNANRA